MSKGITHIASLALIMGLTLGGAYSMTPWEDDEEFKAMVKHRKGQLFHSVKNGASWRRLVHTMFEEETNGNNRV
jgi:hypothetical protein